MSGHSKWHNIQKTKGAADAKRSAAFTKIAKEIIVAVKQGGSGDPNNNSRLATVIAKAKAANMPNDNIKRTIDKALGSGNTDNYESVTYEGYGPCGVAVIVEALTDNRQRTAPEIRHYFDKFGKGMGAQGCVSWSFDRKGVIVIDNEEGELDEDTVMMDALDAGAEDMQADGPVFEITTDPDSFNDAEVYIDIARQCFGLPSKLKPEKKPVLCENFYCANDVTVHNHGIACTESCLVCLGVA